MVLSIIQEVIEFTAGKPVVTVNVQALLTQEEDGLLKKKMAYSRRGGLFQRL